MPEKLVIPFDPDFDRAPATGLNARPLDPVMVSATASAHEVDDNFSFSINLNWETILFVLVLAMVALTILSNIKLFQLTKILG